jgi:F-box protein 11
VDISQHGDFASVAAAIAAADPGDRILVRPGLYEESLLVDKPLEIIGDGPVQDIEIRAHGVHVLTFRATIGRIANLTLQTTSGVWGVMISQGRLDLEGCDISSRGGSCVFITSGADPRLRRNKIHDAKEAGVYVYNNGLGTLEDNEIRGNGSWGAVIRVGGNSVLRRNQICDNVRLGVEVYDDGLGVFEDNEISGNGYVGMEIRSGGNPTVRRNRINRNAHQAVFIHDGGKGVFEDNDMTGNTRGAWLVQRACEPDVTRARNTE